MADAGNPASGADSGAPERSTFPATIPQTPEIDPETLARELLRRAADAADPAPLIAAAQALLAGARVGALRKAT